MLKNKFMSAAAAVVLATTSGLAYDSNSNGDIVAYNGPTAPAGYNPNVAYTSTIATIKSDMNTTNVLFNDKNLTLSETQFGDALVYPAFKQTDYWDTEIAVRNSSINAIVAKVVLYAADDSREVIDFNIYLSGKDVFKFTIANGAITFADKSAVQNAALPHTLTENAKSDISSEVVMNDTEVSFTNGSLKDVEAGYVVVYAMAESDSFNENTDKLAYHNNHKQLFLDYRIALDECRPNWRDSFKTDGMKSGMPTGAISAPNVNPNCDDANTSDSTKSYTSDTATISSKARVANEDVNFTNPSPSLYGSVRINSKNTADLGARDLLLPATAIENFTSDSMMLWSEGEYASIQDRRIKDIDNNDSTAEYNATAILADSQAFAVNTAYYTFKETDVSNSLLVVQPYKRIITQLFPSTKDGIVSNKDLITGSSLPLTYDATKFTGKEYGGFMMNSMSYNENEMKQTETPGSSSIITSPYNPGSTTVSDPIYPEMVGIANIQKPGGVYLTTSTEGEIKNGFTEFSATSSIYQTQSKKFSAIITQMAGTSVENEPQTNWIYAPVK